jgi:uncharacterized protein with NRDE domain
MCTVSIVPVGADGFRVMCNRDERRTRPIALAPRVERAGGHDAIFPKDPLGGGTWIGVNTAGLAVAVLNRHDDHSRDRTCGAGQSRGAIGVGVLRHGRLDEAVRWAGSLTADDFAPFRLVALHKHRLVVVSCDGYAIDVSRRTLVAPVMFTSSSLGDDRVAPLRRALFEQLVTQRSERWLSGQLRFHSHQWPERPEVSVLMDRADATTVSRSTIDVGPRGVHFRYEPLIETAMAA